MNYRVLIVADSASVRFGGEAALPFHYYRVLRSRGVATWLLVHERTREELCQLFPDDPNIFYTPDSFWHRFLCNRVAPLLPARLSHFTIGYLIRLLTQIAQRPVIRSLIKEHGVNIIHQPVPVSPKEPSMIFGMGVPTVIGPMNGGMEYPPGFQNTDSLLVKLGIGIGRKVANLMNLLIPGKRQAAILLVANSRTYKALPKVASKQVLEVVENGVDLSLWQPITERNQSACSVTRFVFIGRLISLKGVDILLTAFNQLTKQTSASLTIVGDGDQKSLLEKQAEQLNILGTEPNQIGKVFFSGWLSQAECSEQLTESDVLVLPSLHECGGAVVLEAMAKQLAVVATNWGGPADYIDESCGILVEPTSKEALIDGFSKAMLKLTQFPEMQQAMGEAGRRKVLERFDWEAKVNTILQVYKMAIVQQASTAPTYVSNESRVKPIPVLNQLT